MKNNLPRFALFVAVASLTTTGFAQDAHGPPKPYALTQSTGQPLLLGVELEREYRNYLESCGLPNGLLRTVRPKVAVSAIDTRIWKALGLDMEPRMQISRVVRSSLGTIFSHVWTAEEERDITPKWAPERLLPLNENQLDSLPVEGLPSVVKQSTCASIVSGHFEASGSSPFPIVTLEAAIRAEAKVDVQARMNVMHGNFRNPIWQMWIGRSVDSSTHQADKLYASLVFWEWRMRNPLATSARILSNFEGTHVFRSLRANNDLSADSSFEAKGSYLVFNAGTGVNNSIQQGSLLRLSDYSLMMSADATNRNFVDLPDAQEIAKELSNSVLRVAYIPQEGNQVEGRQPKTMHVVFPRLPKSFCSNSKWDVVDTSVPGSNTYSLSEPAVMVNSTNESAECQFTLLFTPSTASSSVDNLTPYLISKGFIKTTSEPQVRIRIPFALGLSRSSVPTIQFESAGTYSVTPNVGLPLTANVTTRYTFAIRGMAGYGGNPGVDAEDITLSCPNGFGGAHPQWSVRLQGNASIRTLELIGSGIHNGALAPDQSVQQCSMSGTLKLRRAGANYDVAVALPTTAVPYPMPATLPAQSAR